ncbi:molybdopterin converting factor subunit 1 [Priestia koreensis]|uniref:molybdopterin converting factor subunit 1 n=1 Tax=Priestia koreensis TaxID=284581 RepID=UPI001F5647BE|nr:molybdopterin converting factor subunit 1 [Priestia koreensis]MCM3004835.1 molybdopterin converting factor subunit 1 [Priestia koreensis]UNL85632.1 molybdopterin converting factor subunit 1 [Priestia koreensis]
MYNVLFFAHLQEEAGVESIQLDNAPLTIGELKKQLLEQYQFTLSKQVMFAINEEFAIDEDTIKDGDVVALIPPVSGG